MYDWTITLSNDDNEQKLNNNCEDTYENGGVSVYIKRPIDVGVWKVVASHGAV